jgi:hypothetical protein
MKKLSIFILIFLLIIPLSPQAKTESINEKNIFLFLQEAFKAQVSLSEFPRTKKEITELLNPYFSMSYQSMFWTENMVEEEGRFLTYGSDFAPYYIPYFQYSEDTRIIQKPGEIYVFEYFPAMNEGPVIYEGHFKGLLLKKFNDIWKVDKLYIGNMPKAIIEGYR